MIEATKRYPRDEHGYYVVERSGEACRWLWVEEGQDNDHGTWRRKISEALREAADDWDRNGDGGRLTGTLRRAATAYEKQGK